MKKYTRNLNDNSPSINNNRNRLDFKKTKKRMPLNILDGDKY